MGFFDEYFFSRAQGYFTKSLYNNDAEIAYEEAWNNKAYVASVDIHPLAQSLGDHYLAEREFIEKRLVYLMSKFGFGGYGNYEDKELGVISLRTQTAQSFTLTPAIDSFPTILGGASQISSSSQRVKAGESIALPAVGGGNTNTYIAGADWLQDIGDLKDLKVDPSMVLALNVSSKRLQSLKVGDEDASAVTSTLEKLEIQSCPSLKRVDARNLSALTSTVDLSQCPRLREALFGGTNVTAVKIAGGSKIEHLQLPDSITVLDLRNTKFLDNFEVGDLTHIGFLRLENNKYIDGFTSLKEAYGADGGALQNVRVIGFTYDGDATDVDMLANLSSKAYGIDSDGKPTTGNPVIEGTLNVAGSIYEDAGEVVKSKYPNLTLNVLGGYYVRFADAEVQRICVTNWGDGIGITSSQVAEVETLARYFVGNTNITSLNELRYFTGLDSLHNSAASYNYGTFNGCANLTNVTLPSSIKSLGVASFAACSSLRSIGDATNVESLGERCFDSSPLEGFKVKLSSLMNIGYGAFYNTQIDSVVDLGNLSIIPDGVYIGGKTRGVFGSCTQLRVAILPSTITTIGTVAFEKCSNLKGVVIKATTPPTLNNTNAFNSTNNCLIYVPDDGTGAIVQAYKTATNWSSYASRIFPISQLATDIAEIEEYL